MNALQSIDFFKRTNLMIKQSATKAASEKNYVNFRFCVNSEIENLCCIGLLQWRMEQSPEASFKEALEIRSAAPTILRELDLERADLYPLDGWVTIYVASLMQQPHPFVDPELESDHVKAACFFGNVLMGYADIADWPKYRDVLPEGKRYDLARKTNELYAGLLAGTITPEEGVKLGEKLWAKRANHEYFDTATGGSGNDNQQTVDYQLAAILKKIGSTVPTVHAWRW